MFANQLELDGAGTAGEDGGSRILHSEERRSYTKRPSNTIRRAVRILFIATKSPWPAVDGGRLLIAKTLDELAALGHRVTLVAPAATPAGKAAAEAAPENCGVHLVAARPRPFLLALALAQLRGLPLSIVRHSLAAVRREVDRLLAEDRFDVVHVEQLQALAQAGPAFERGVPVVLRAQNVESDLWAGTAAARRFGFLTAREARRLARGEGDAVARVHATVALTSEDAASLRELAGGRGRLRVVRVPFAAWLPDSGSPLPGDPALVLLGSGGWLPNRDAVEWFLTSVWPAVRGELPEARLHVYGHRSGPAPPGAVAHAPPVDSREAFAPGSVMVVPLRIGSGVRMKILEAWARGVPVVATPQAARGLQAEDGRDVLLGGDAAELAGAFRRLHAEAGLAERLVAGGRASLAARHDPAVVTEQLLEVYETVRRGEAVNRPSW